jgi:hypothetical protein
MFSQFVMFGPNVFTVDMRWLFGTFGSPAGAESVKATFSPHWQGEPGEKRVLETHLLSFTGHVWTRLQLGVI